MKILLISLPRTGSHSLMFKLAEEHNLKIHSEPFYIKNRKQNININWELEENFILKTIVNQVPADGIYNIDFYKQFSNIFDEVILLSRRDLIACAESCSYMTYYLDKGFSYNIKYKWKLTPNYNEIKSYIEKCNTDLLTLSTILHKDIIYYEDIFNLNSDDRLRIGDETKRII